MHITNDFFQLIWQEDAKSLFSSFGDIEGFLNTALKRDYEAFYDFTSIILVVSSTNIEQFSQIKEARDAMSFLVGLEEWDKKSVQYLQKELLFFLKHKGNRKLNKEIESVFVKLKPELDSLNLFYYTEDQKQIYSTIGGTPHLDQNYTVFGEIIEGLNIVDSIANVKTDKNNRPLENVIMNMKVVRK